MMTKEEKIKEAQRRKQAIQDKIAELHKKADAGLETAKKAHEILDKLAEEKKTSS